jgi:hypothetical protein
MNASKNEIVSLLSAWIHQRPGLEYANYGDRQAYRCEVRNITAQLHDARTLLAAVSISSMTAEQLAEGFRAYSGRLQLVENADGIKLEYCTGQYFPTEYRAAACAVLAYALWEYQRNDFDVQDASNKGDAIRAKFRRIFGRTIANRWFN